jgi:ribosome-associated translation inhibitor RaiA
VEIHWRNMDEIDEKQRELIERKLRALADGQSDLIDLRIAAKPNSHHRHGGQEVHIACLARGKEIVATRMGSDLGQALHDAVDAFVGEVRKLRERRSERRGELGG